MSSFFDVTLEGRAALHKELLALQARGQSLDHVIPTVAEMLVGAVNDVVEAEGPGWEPLAEATLAARRRQGRGAKMLQDTGAMMLTLGPGWGSDYAEAIFGSEYAPAAFGGGKNGTPLRDPTNLGPYLEPLLDDVEELILQNVT